MGASVLWYREKLLSEIRSLREPMLKELILLVQLVKLRVSAHPPLRTPPAAIEPLLSPAGPEGAPRAEEFSGLSPLDA